MNNDKESTKLESLLLNDKDSKRRIAIKGAEAKVEAIRVSTLEKRSKSHQAFNLIGYLR